MKKMLMVTLLFALTATLAFALEQPTVTMPQPGAELGPNYDVLGKMPYRAFLVVMTDCIDAKTGLTLRSVPGIRHWTFDDGSFHFRVASPRVSIGEKQTELIYRVRVFESSANGDGPETAIDCKMAR
ncbi:MAG: hypothetical protein ABFE08_04115 [Armatimonadia bacterium]